MKGLLVGFESEAALVDAMERLTAEHIEAIDTYTPAPLESDRAGSSLPLVMFIAGMLGFVGFFLLMTYADVRAYPLDIGGRPEFAWPAFVPIAFELGVLCAMGAGFLGFFVLCRMPRLYETVDECASFRGASRDVWFLAVRARDPTELALARGVLEPLRPANVEEFAQ